MPPKNDILIRKAQIEDIDAITDIENRSFSIPWKPASFSAVLRHNALTMLVALIDDRIVGYAVISCVIDEGELMNIACDPEKRRRGIAKALLGECIDIWKRSGILNVFLEVRSSNEAAKELYLSNGFKNIGFRKNYYKQPLEDAILMRRSFDDQNN